jgi:hypothetical protein
VDGRGTVGPQPGRNTADAGATRPSGRVVRTVTSVEAIDPWGKSGCRRQKSPKAIQNSEGVEGAMRAAIGTRLVIVLVAGLLVASAASAEARQHVSPPSRSLAHRLRDRTLLRLDRLTQADPISPAVHRGEGSQLVPTLR